MSGLPGTPVARDTRPPAAGPTFRYLSALNSLGDSGLSVFGASCAWTETMSAVAIVAQRRDFEKCMRGSLAYASALCRARRHRPDIPLRNPSPQAGKTPRRRLIGDWRLASEHCTEVRLSISEWVARTATSV